MLKKLKHYWYQFKKRYLSFLIAYGAKAGVNLLMRTCKVEIIGLDHFVSTASDHPCILMLWHNRMIALPDVLYKNVPQFNYTAFVSKSRDGEPLALIAESYRIGNALRVPHNAKHKALGQMISLLSKPGEVMLVTPDGPRGPRCEVKPGIVLAASKSAAKIVPFSWDGDRVWKLNTWDGMMIPKPFAKIRVTFGMPLSLDQAPEINAEAARLKAALQVLEGG